MKTYLKAIIAVAAMSACSLAASAQYYQLANQATNIFETILRGGGSYRGFVDVSYLNGIGDRKASFGEITTTHGAQYGSHFFMGLGLGIDKMWTNSNPGGYVPDAATTTNAWMVPIFTDFRVNIGNTQSTTFFISCRLGAAFYIGNKYILVGDGYVNSGESFYLRPSIGFRIPISKDNPKYAINVGASYQLLSNSYWYNPGQRNSITLSSIGASIGFEW